MIPLVVRDAPAPTATAQSAPAGPPLTPPRPPGFDPSIYLTVPTFNKRTDLLALVITFMVRLRRPPDPLVRLHRDLTG